MKNRMFGFLAIVLASFVSFFGFASEARAGSFSTNFGNSYTLDNFDVFWGGGEYDGEVSVYLTVTSPVHRIAQMNTDFSTDFEDPSEARGGITFFGIKNNSPNQDQMNSNSSLSIGGVNLVQSSGINFMEDYYPYGEVNRAYSNIFVTPFDLETGSLWYYENTFPDTPEITYFSFHLSFTGSFGDGPEGDARGMAFRAVPTPGATALFGLSGLALLRRLRRR